MPDNDHASDLFDVRFELQAIANAVDLSVYGYEFLYRGKVRPTSAAAWANIDQGVLRYLGEVSLGLDKPCFINLSHESLLSLPERAFKAACAYNDVRFEMSEAVTEGVIFDRVCDKVNRLTGRGVHFAIDDFGAGLDGSRRLYALDRVAVIKVDRGLLISAEDRPQAAQMLKASVASWKAAGMHTVAEGVETPELLEVARDLEFDLVQGWHVDKIARPKQAIIGRAFFDHFCSVLCTYNRLMQPRQRLFGKTQAGQQSNIVLWSLHVRTTLCRSKRSWPPGGQVSATAGCDAHGVAS